MSEHARVCIVGGDQMNDLHAPQDQVVRDQSPMASLRRAFSAEYGRGRPGGQIDELGGALLKVIGFHVVGVAAQPFVQGAVPGIRSGGSKTPELAATISSPLCCPGSSTRAPDSRAIRAPAA